MSARGALCASAAIVSLMTASAAAAQATVEQQVGETAAAADEGVVDIVVVANRREQNLQEVPIAITAFTGETLETAGVESVVDLPNITPGLTITRTIAGAGSYLRGVGTNNAGYTTETPVAVYLDGIYLPNAAAAAFSFNNIERIEVLKGPQGTLYGRNTTGGLIHVITREPGSQPQLDASATYANYDTVKLDFYGSVPLSDTLSANMSATYVNQADGWGRNNFLNQEAYTFEDFGVQGKIKWQPGPDTTVTFQGFYDRFNTDQGNTSGVYPGSVAPGGQQFIDEFTVNVREKPFVIQRQAIGALKIQHDFGIATLNSITAALDNRSPTVTPSAFPLGVTLTGVQEAKTFSQEVNLTSNDKGSALEWIVGLFYYKDTTRLRIDLYGQCAGAVAASCVPNPPPNRTFGNQHTRSYSAYGEGTYNFTPATRLTLGLRYTRDKKTFDGTLVPLPGRPNSFPAFPPGFVTNPEQAIDTSKVFSEFSWRAVLAHDITPDVHAYGSYSRGFKSGGFNLTNFTNPASEPETIDAFELGLKSELFDNMLRLNLAAFYYNYKDIQLRSTAGAPPGQTLLLNAASADIKGLEAEFLLAPTRGLTINGGLQLLDAKFDDFPAGVCTVPRPFPPGGALATTCSLAGFDLPNAPEFSYNLGITYSFDTSIGNFELNASDNYKSTFYFEPDNRLEQENYHLVNAAITWTHPDERFSLRLFARNVFDKFFFTAAANTLGSDIYTPGAPRTYGVTARYRF